MLTASEPDWQEPVDRDHDRDLGLVFSGLAGVARRRWRLFAVVSAVVFALIIVAVLLVTPKYVATARLKIDPHLAPASLTEASPSNPDQSVIDTEASIMASPAIARAVVEKLDLANDREFRPANAAALSPEQRLQLTVDGVVRALTVEREKSTYIVDISFRSISPARAAQVANQFAATYLSNNLGLRNGTASRQATLLRKRLDEATAELNQLDAIAAQYRAQAGIIGSGGAGGFSGTVADQQAASLSTQLAQAESQASSDQSKLAVARAQMAQGGLDAVSAVLQSAVVTDLRRQRAEVVRNMGEIQARYGPKHPETIKVQQQLAELDSQIDQEARRVIGSLASEAASSAAAAASLRRQMSSIRGQQTANTHSGALAQSATQKADAQRATVSQLSQELQQISEQSRSTQTQVQIIDEATPPETPAYPNKRLALMAGALIAVVLGLVAAAMREMLASGLRSIEDVEGRLRVPFIASIPRIKDSRGSNHADVLIDKPISPFGEAFRTLRGQLVLAKPRPKILTFISAMPDEGKSTSILALGRVLAQSGDRTLLIDCDIRKAGLSAQLALSEGLGIVDLLRGDATLDQAIRPDKVANLDVVPCVAPTFTPEDLFASEAMLKLLKEARLRYDFVLLDTPPILGVVDARTIATMADAVVLLIRWNKTPLKLLRNALSILDQIQAPLIGAMYSIVSPRSEAMGGLYYYKSYSHYYQQS